MWHMWMLLFKKGWYNSNISTFYASRKLEWSATGHQTTVYWLVIVFIIVKLRNNEWMIMWNRKFLSLKMIINVICYLVVYLCKFNRLYFFLYYGEYTIMIEIQSVLVKRLYLRQNCFCVSLSTYSNMLSHQY